MNASPQPVKYSCSGLWKVYGGTSKSRFDPAICDRSLEDRLSDVRESGDIVACAEVEIEIPAGETFIIMGLSGSGKSTVLRCLSRLVEPSCGRVTLDGVDLLSTSPSELIDIRRHKMGMVFQNFGLLPHLTVLDNVAFPLRVQGIPADDRRKRALSMIELVSLNGREDAYPHELSGGQQQRVGIARSLAVEPDVWFLDEPFSALDPLIRTNMQDEFMRLRDQLNKTIVFVTHDMMEALRLADRICIMKDGCIVQIGTPSEIVLDPATDYVSRFTSDVPLDKVLTADSIMGPPGDGGNGRPKIPADTLLDDAIRAFGDDSGVIDITGPDGAVAGSLTAVQVIRALNRVHVPAGY